MYAMYMSNNLGRRDGKPGAEDLSGRVQIPFFLGTGDKIDCCKCGENTHHIFTLHVGGTVEGEQMAFPATQRIGILVFDGFEPIDVFGFVEAFTIARFLGTKYASPPPYPFETVLIASDIANVRSASGPQVAPDWDFAKALAQPLDLLMVPGGRGTWTLLDETSHPRSVSMFLDWMRAMDKKVRIMASVC